MTRSWPCAPSAGTRPIPITVVTGFLGSGKTTLLNHVLLAGGGARIGVLVNEFGEINIDSRLIAAREEDLIELSNGCVCCAVRDDLLRAVATLLERPRPPDHLVVETTGLADPAPIAAQLLDPRIQRDVRLDAVVTLVDAVNFDRNLDHAEQAYSQIVHGDILVVNKTDLAAAGSIEQIETGLRRLNPRARILRAAHGRVDLDLLLGVGLGEPRVPGPAPPVGAAHRGRDDGSEHARRSHTDRFRAVSLRFDAPVNLDRLAVLLDDIPQSVIRGKGIVAVAGARVRFVFHLVGERWTISAGDAWGPGEGHRTEMVFIGKDLTDSDQAILRARLRRCLEEPVEEPLEGPRR